jgi:L-threonylcarbamoyladenylate synthase
VTDEGDQIDAVVAALEAGEAVVLPTDTVYGLAALAADHEATAKLFAIKGRTADVPVAVLCADAEQALALAEGGGDAPVRAVAARWWPGAVTLVVRRAAHVDLHLGEPRHTIGLRVPDHDLVRAVAARVGPIATTSANLTGQAPVTTAAMARHALGPAVGLVVDGGLLEGRASAVLDATTQPWAVLRPSAAVADILALVEASDGSAG